MYALKVLPVAVIGAGPIGLAAAAHLISRGMEPLVFERGETIASTVAEWARVRVYRQCRAQPSRAARMVDA